jgi:hypothetical protein
MVAVGATTACTLAAELETMGRSTHLDGAMDRIEELETELARIVAFFAEPGWDRPTPPMARQGDSGCVPDAAIAGALRG